MLHVEVSHFILDNVLDLLEKVVDSDVDTQIPIVDNCPQVLQNGLYLPSDLIVFNPENVLTVINENFFINQAKPAHLA